MLKRKRAKAYKKYALAFIDRVRADYPIIGALSSEYPKIELYTEQGYTSCKEKNETLRNIAQKSPHGYALISGEYDDERKTVILYHYTREAPAYNKETLRHECIHFILDAAGLPNGDEEPLFLVLAMDYNAQPYMILKEGVLERIRETAEGFGLDLGI